MNEPRRRGPIASILVGIWDAMNFTRRLILNLLFFGLLLLFLAALGAGSQRVLPVENRSTLVIAPEGVLVEQYSTDPASRALAEALGDNAAQEIQLRDLLQVLNAAKTDKRIERVLLRVDGMRFSGYASIREVAEALAALRASGKQIVAFGEYFDQSQYLLAAQANEIYLDPMGGMVLEGLSRYRQYYREGLQDKLGVDVHLFKVGEYKSAAEPYVLDAASPEAKEADLFWMNDIWQRYLGDIAKARKLDAAKLAASIETLPADIATAQGDLAKYALQQKWVDGLKTQEEVETLLTKRGMADEQASGGFRQISFGNYLAHLNGTPPMLGDKGHVAVVVAEGEIVGGEQPPGIVGGESTAALLRDARDDERTKAVVLRVDSPGGEVFASEQIRREIVALKKAGKPVIVSMGDLAASGGYWISMNADRIYADPSTITGSIGIYGMIPTFSRTLEKIGVRTDGVATTPIAGAFDVTRPLSPQTAQVMQTVIEKGYRDFTGRVSEARKKPVADVDAVARGRVWSGAQAKERGLVDAFGGLQTALNDAAKRVKLGDKPGTYDVRYIEHEPTPFERWFGGFASSGVGRALLGRSDFARDVLAKVAPQAERDLKFIERAASANGKLQTQAIAYCFCGF
ncbi:MAG: signal peptide peptidase SppA [Pseudomonadota bacterium]